MSGSRGLKRPRLRSLLLISLLIAIIASSYMAQEVQIRQPLTNFSVVPRPFLNYSTMEFKQVSMVRDVWNESFEYPTSSQNHYWYSGVGTVTGGATSLNDTLDPGFEEVSSTGSNPNVNLPSWFAVGDFNDATVRVRRSSTLSYDQTYSALVETRYTNTSAIDYEFTWETPITVYDSCGYDGDNLPDNTIDDSTTSQWEHDETETHWIIYDLNQSYVVRAVRVYCGTYRLKDVNVYVSDNPSDFGQPVVELWDPPSSGWNVSPEFIKKGRYIKLEFDTTRSDGWLYNTFYEFDAKIQTTIKGHVKGGIKTIDDYFVKTTPVNLYENPTFSLHFLVDEADPGSGSCDAYYLRIELGLNNESTILSIIYIVPVTPVGSPSPSHFTNTTTEKYIYGASTVSTLDAWTSLSRNVTSDYQSLWGTLDNATIVWIRIENDLYNPVTDSESNGPIMKVYYDAASLVISTDEEELPNGSFEAPGWRLIQSNKMSSLNYTKDSSESMDGTTSYYMDVTSDTSGTESGSTFSVTKHCVVGIGESSFIREANDSQTLRIHAYIKVVSMANISNTLYSFVGLRVRFKELEFPYDTYDLYYCIMLRGSPPSGSSSEKYIELVKSTNLQTGVWYGITRNPMADGGWTNVKIVQIGMVVALYFGSTSSTEEVNVVARYDQIQLLLSTGSSTLEETGLAERSTTYTLHGNYSLKLNVTQGYSFAGYETGAENENNTYYVAFPKYLNFSAYYLIESYGGDITIQISLGIDDGPVYGDGYIWELIYYYGSPSGVSPIFSPSVSTEIIQISPSVTTSTWVRLLRNWTLDLPESWTYYNPRVEAVGLKVWCSGEASTYWDLVAFYGAWKGVRKVIELESRNDLYVRKLNVTDFWTVSGDQPGGVNDFVDNRSNVDNSPDVGEHSNFTAMKHGPDYVYDVLTEGYRELYSSQDYVDRRSDVDGRPDRGTHSNFTAMQYGPDSIFDVLAEEDRGPGNDSQNYVDQMSNEDGSPDRGTHSNFTAMQYGPDFTYDVLTEANTNPPPNDIEDYVDQTSNVDGSPDKGTHSNFAAMQYGPDSTFDVLTEEDTSPPMIIIRDYIDNNSSDVDSSPNIGHFTNFTAMQYGPDSDSDTLVEEMVEGEEYEFYYTDTMVNTQAGSTYVTAVQLTFQPEETGYFLIMGYLETRSTSINSLVSVELQVDSTQYCYQNYKYKDGAAPDWNPFTGIIRLELDNATTHTVRIRFKGSAGTQYAQHGYIMAWAVPVEESAVSEGQSSTTSKSWQDKLTLTWTPSVDGNRLIFWFAEIDASSSYFSTEARFRYDQEAVNWGFTEHESRASANKWVFAGFKRVYLNASTQYSFSIDYRSEGGNWFLGWNTAYIRRARIYIVNLDGLSLLNYYSEDDSATQPGTTWSDKVTNTYTPQAGDYIIMGTIAWSGGSTSTSAGYKALLDDSTEIARGFTEEQDPQDTWEMIFFKKVSLAAAQRTDRIQHRSESSDAGVTEYARLIAIGLKPKSYRLELEAQFTDVDYEKDFKALCIYTGDLDTEDMKVDCWNGSAWINLLDKLNPNAWNNVTVTDYVTGPNFTVRFRDTPGLADGSQSSWEIDAVLLRLWDIHDITDYVDRRSDVDNSPDVGTHSNFTAMQYGPDSEFDVLTEQDLGGGTGGWTTPVAIYDVCGEESGYPASNTIDDDSYTEWRHYGSWWHTRHWIVFDMGSSMLITKLKIRTGTYGLRDIRVYISEDTVFDDSEVVIDDWDVPSGGWSVSPTFEAKGRYVGLGRIISTAGDWWNIYEAFYEFDAYTEKRYQLDLEVQFTDVDYTESNEYLCIYVGDTGDEDLYVDVWTGSAWVNIRTDLYQGWNNISVHQYLNGPNFTVRFRDGVRGLDLIQDSWEIDAVLLHLWTPSGPNYELDLEVQFTDVDYIEAEEELCIYAGSLDEEALRVDYWTGSGWVTLIEALQPNSWNNVSVSLTSSTFTIRFKGTNETDDKVQSSWEIDAVLLHVWTDGPRYELDLEVQFTNVDYDEVYEELCIYTGNLGNESLRVEGWDQDHWVLLIDELKPNAWNNVSVSDYLNGPTFTIRFKGANDTDDVEQDSWEIDAVLLHLWTPDTPNYELDLEVQWVDVDYSQENEWLCIKTGDLGNETLKVECWNGVDWFTLIEALQPNSWNNVSVSLVSSTFTIRFKATSEFNDTVQDSWEIDAVLLHLWTEGGYQLDLEVQFTEVDYTQLHEELCIYTGDLGNETLIVDYWTGDTWVTLINGLSPNSWNNVTVSLDSSVFTIRFRGAEDVTEDRDQDSWEIDAVLLHVWTDGGYELDLEVQFTDVDAYNKYAKLCIKTGELDAESLMVDYWTGTGWKNVISSLQPYQWNNYSVTITSSEFTIRFKGGSELTDPTQSNWEIDVVALYLWDKYPFPSMARANSTAANQWYYKWWGIRRIWVINSTGTYEITANSTAQGILSFYDEDWMVEDESSLNDFDGYVKYNVTDFQLTAYGKDMEYLDKVLVEYYILICGPAGSIKYFNNSTATAAVDPYLYGEEWWIMDKVGNEYRNYIASNSTKIIDYGYP